MTPWTVSDSREMGNALLDADHHILGTLVDQLDDAVDTGQSRDVVGSVINVLAEYAEQHFLREEAALAAARFPGLAEHAAEHRAIAQVIRDARDGWMAGQAGALNESVLAAIRKRLTNHTLVGDKLCETWCGHGD